MMRMSIHVSEVQFCLILPLEIADSVALKGRMDVCWVRTKRILNTLRIARNPHIHSHSTPRSARELVHKLEKKISSLVVLVLL